MGLLKENDSYGERELLTGSNHKETITANSDLHAWILRKHKFDELINVSPKLATEIKHLIDNKLEIIISKDSSEADHIEKW